MISFTYKNHRGEIAVRNVEPIGVEFLHDVGFGYQPGWFLRAWDFDKKVERSFALSHIVFEKGQEDLQFKWGIAAEHGFVP